jgi:type 1 glutamine amidotransferase
MPECENQGKLNSPFMSAVKVALASDPMPGAAIRITIPLSVAGNIEKMQNVTKTILKRLGHEGCHSGFQFHFHMEDDYRFNEKGELLQF